MPDDPLLLARLQMAFTLGAHIVLACLGVGLPVMLLIAEGMGIRRRDPSWTALARRWSKAFAVLFALGAVSGTVLSFELGLLWPELMGRYGAVFGMPFTLESFAFFLEAIFAGIYLYGWDRLSPRAHWWTGVPIAIAGIASSVFVICANAWMNAPVGFDLGPDGEVIDPRPFAAMFGPAAATQIAHMVVAALLVTGCIVAARHAWALLRSSGRPARSHRRGLALGLGLAAVMAPLQALTGHAAAQMVAGSQPVKFAAMEGHFRTEAQAPLRIGGLPDEAAMETPYAIEIPYALSILAFDDPNAEVIGLEEFPRDEWPPVSIVHIAFQIMVGLGSLLMLLAAWAAIRLVRKRPWATHRPLLAACVLSAPAAILALQAGWVVTEVGRQPWIVQGLMRTEEAVGEVPAMGWVFGATLVLYAGLAVAAGAVLVQLGRLPMDEAEWSGEEPQHVA